MPYKVAFVENAAVPGWLETKNKLLMLIAGNLDWYNTHCGLSSWHLGLKWQSLLSIKIRNENVCAKWYNGLREAWIEAVHVGWYNGYNLHQTTLIEMHELKAIMKLSTQEAELVNNVDVTD